MTPGAPLRVVLVGPAVHLDHDDVLRAPGVDVVALTVPGSATTRSRAARLVREVVAPSVVALGVHRVAAHRRLLRGADVVVATTPDAVLAVRLAGLRNHRAALVNGLPAAQRYVARVISAGAR